MKGYILIQGYWIYICGIYKPKLHLYIKMKAFIRKWNQTAGGNKFILNIFRRSGGVSIAIVSLRTTTMPSASKNLTC